MATFVFINMSQCKILIANLSSYYAELMLEYFVLVSYKKNLKYSIFTKLTPFPKNIVNLNWALRILWWDNSSRISQSKDIRYTFITFAEDGLMKILGKSYSSWNLVADAAQVTQGSRLFFKEINRFQANDCNATASFYGVACKTTTSIQRLLK
jgi:hypothetical protein